MIKNNISAMCAMPNLITEVLLGNVTLRISSVFI